MLKQVHSNNISMEIPRNGERSTKNYESRRVTEAGFYQPRASLLYQRSPTPRALGLGRNLNLCESGLGTRTRPIILSIPLVAWALSSRDNGTSAEPQAGYQVPKLYSRFLF